MASKSDENDLIISQLIARLTDDERTRVQQELRRRERERLRRGDPIGMVVWDEEPSAIDTFTASLNGQTASRRRGVLINDPRGGAEYIVFLNEQGGIAELRIIAGGGSLAEVRELERPFLALLANEYLAQVERPDGELFVYVGAKRTEPPSLNYVAGVARRARRAGQPVRKTLAALASVSESTVDRWLRAARDAGLLEPDGRGRKKTTTKNGAAE